MERSRIPGLLMLSFLAAPLGCGGDSNSASSGKPGEPDIAYKAGMAISSAQSFERTAKKSKPSRNTDGSSRNTPRHLKPNSRPTASKPSAGNDWFRKRGQEPFLALAIVRLGHAKRLLTRMALPPVAIEVTAIRSFGKRTRGLRPLGFEARFATSRSD